MNKDILLEEKERIGTWGNINRDRLEIILKYAYKNILDAGCSSGTYVRYLLTKGYDAYGFDLLPAEEWKGPARERFRSGDLHQTPYSDREFESVTAFEVLEHVEDPNRVLKELLRITRKNIILSVPDSELRPLFKQSGMAYYHWVDRSHIHFFTEKSLANKLLEFGLSIQFLGKINPVYPEVIFFDSLRIPLLLKKSFVKMARMWPCIKRYRMTLIVVANKADT